MYKQPISVVLGSSEQKVSNQADILERTMRSPDLGRIRGHEILM